MLGKTKKQTEKKMSSSPKESDSQAYMYRGLHFVLNKEVKRLNSLFNFFNEKSLMPSPRIYAIQTKTKRKQLKLRDFEYVRH